MMDRQHRIDLFEEYRPRLFALAYQMLGLQTEAQDVVQEVYIRWQKAEKVQSPGAYLTRTTTNLCIDMLRSALKKRQEYVGIWLPEPIETSPANDPAYTTELADSLSLAFLRLLETLTPTERAVFLLREVFAADYDEIAGVVGRTATNCRQIAHRARQRIQTDSPPRFDTSLEVRDKLMNQFCDAVRSGDFDQVKALLAQDITVYSDGGGKVAAARRSFTGIEKVSNFLQGVHRKYMAAFEMREVWLNNEPGIIFSQDGKAQAAWSIHIENGKIKNLLIVLNPDKLEKL